MSNDTAKEDFPDQDQRLAVCHSQWRKKKEAGGDMQDVERRALTADMQIKRSKGSKSKIVGYAAVFDSLSEDLGGFQERIKPGAFKAALERSDVRALVNHDQNYLLGRQGAGTLRLKEDKRGLHMEIDPPNTTYANDLMELIERGDIHQQSFGFTVKSDSWENVNSRDIAIRTIEEVDRIYDVSPVVFPAYPDTTVAVRRLQMATAPKPEPEPEEAEQPKFTLVAEPDQRTAYIKEAITLIGQAITETLAEFSKRLDDKDDNESRQTPAEPEPETRQEQEPPADDDGQTSDNLPTWDDIDKRYQQKLKKFEGV